MSLAIEPSGSQVAVRFLDAEPTVGTSLAVCLGVGGDVSVCKRGETVLVQPYARHNGIHVSDGVVICEEYLVAPAQ